jgi:hypothetical protein
MFKNYVNLRTKETTLHCTIRTYAFRKDEMGRTCRTYRRNGKWTKILARRSEGKWLLRNPRYRWDEYSKHILIEIGRVGVNWLRIRPGDGFLWTWQHNFGFHKGREYSDQLWHSQHFKINCNSYNKAYSPRVLLGRFKLEQILEYSLV